MKMRNYNNRLLRKAYRGIALLFCILIISCGPDLDKKISFDQSCWHISDTLEYQFSGSQQAGRLVIRPYIEFEEDYAYRNLFLKVLVDEGNSRVIDTVIQDIVVDPEGYWKDKASLRGSYPHFFTSSIPLEVDKTNEYQIRITQYMRDSSLCQISSAGIILAEE